MDKVSKTGLVILLTGFILFTLSHLYRTFDVADKYAIQQDDVSVELEFNYLVDKQQLPLQAIVGQLDTFNKVAWNHAKVDFGPQVYWFYIRVNNLLDDKRVMTLFLDNAMTDEIDVYEMAEGPQLIAQLGDTRLSNNTDLIAFPHIEFTLDSNEHKTFLIRSETVGAPNLPLLVFEQQQFRLYKDAVYILWGAFIGITLLMTVYNLILFIGVSDRVFVFYIGYVIAFMLELGIVHGYLVYLVPVDLFGFFSKNIIPINYMTGYFALIFGLYFLHYDKEPHRLTTRVTRFFLWVYLFAGLVSFFVVEYLSAPPYFLLQLFLYMIAMTFIIEKLRERVRWANYYLISWLPIFIGAAIGPLMLTGKLEYGFWTRHALLFGVLFEIAFMSMALAQRLRTSEKERIFQSTHDHLFGFANENFLEQKLASGLIKKKYKSFSLVLLSIENYDNFLPYLTKSNLKSIVYQLAFDMEQDLGSELYLLDVDENSLFRKVVMTREGVFALLVASNDNNLLTNVLETFTQRQPVSYSSKDVTLVLNCYVGVAQYKYGDDIHTVINRAMQEVDIAQEQNVRFRIFNKEQDSHNRRNVKLTSDLQAALKNNGLELYHQPQISIKTGQVIGSEALLRWNHHELGFISPEEFIRVAEDTGIINTLSRWVFHQACHDLKQLKNHGYEQLSLSVNMSVLDLLTDGFIAYLIETLTAFNLKAEDILIEVTETSNVDNTKKFERNLKEIKDLGFKLSMDDFGTGYSSLTYVSRHPFDEIKIDRQFIQTIESSPKNLTIVKSSIRLSESLGIKTVAEGIENHASLQLLKEMGCDYGQGFYIAKPMPFNQYLDWLEEVHIAEDFNLE